MYFSLYNFDYISYILLYTLIKKICSLSEKCYNSFFSSDMVPVNLLDLGLWTLKMQIAFLIILMEGTVTPVHPPGVQMSCQTGTGPSSCLLKGPGLRFRTAAERVNTQHPTSPIPPACTLLHTLGQRRLAHGEETCTHMCTETTAEELLYLRLKDKM